MTYDDNALSAATVLRAIANNDTLGPAVPRKEPRRMQLLDEMPLPDCLYIGRAVYVGPDSIWACPITFSDVGGQYPSLDDAAIARSIQRDFYALVRAGQLDFPNWRHVGGHRGPITFTYPTLDTIRTAIAGRDIACTCPLDEACHGDVLLRLANPEIQCPECAAGKHRNCTDMTLVDDVWTVCTCHTLDQHTTLTATALAAARNEAWNRP